MKSKKIGITLRVVENTSYVEKRDALSQDWPSLLESINCIPVFIPNSTASTKSILQEMDLDGIILSGGDCIGDNKERDFTEKIILDYAILKKIPVFGVCRGMQVINEFFGGKVTIIENNNHIVKSHKIRLLDSIIFPFFKHDPINVNSFHRNIIKENDLGNELKIFAVLDDDKTVEGFFHSKYPIIGVMWHPERNSTEQDRFLLKQFFYDQSMWSK